MANGGMTSGGFAEALHVFEKKRYCLEQWLRWLEGLWEGEDAKAVLAALEDAERRGFTKEGCEVREKSQTPPALCRRWGDAALEALEALQERAEAVEESQKANELSRLLNAALAYLENLEEIWPQARAMIQTFVEAEPVLEKQQKQEQRARQEEDAAYKRELAKMFLALLKQATEVGRGLLKAEAGEGALAALGWEVAALARIESWRGRAWKVARDGLKAAATRALGLAWTKALGDLELIQEALQRAKGTTQEAKGETLGDVATIQQQAIGRLSANFSKWLQREKQHVTEEVQIVPPKPFGVCAKFWGKSEESAKRS